MKYDQFYEFLIKVHSIAKIGLVYSSDPYALANYDEINKLTMAMIENFNHLKFDRPSYFERDIYPTPNISVRTVIFNDLGQVLFVKESKDGYYSLPGGWCDLYESPSEAAKKECLQEAGALVKLTHLVALLNRTPFKEPLSIPEYVVVFKGKLIKPLTDHHFETSDVAYFDIDKLPPLSRKVSEPEIKKMIHAAMEESIIFD